MNKFNLKKQEKLQRIKLKKNITKYSKILYFLNNYIFRFLYVSINVTHSYCVIWLYYINILIIFVIFENI